MQDADTKTLSTNNKASNTEPSSKKKKSKSLPKGSLDSPRNFRTNPIHSSRGAAKKERPIMQRLGNDLQEAMQFRKKLDALTKSQRAGDLIQHAEQLEHIERGLVETAHPERKNRA